MNAKVNYVLLGVFVLILGAALIGAVLWLSVGGPREDYERYVVYMTESVAGLGTNAAVRYKGVEVGRVQEIEIDPEHPERIRLLIEVQPDTPVKTDTVATLEMQGLTGFVTVNLTGSSREAPPLQAEPGERYPVIPSEPSLLGRLEDRVSSLLASLDETARRLNALLDEENRRAVGEILRHLETSSARVAEHSEALGTSLDHLNATLARTRETAADLPALTEDLARGAAAVERMAEEIRRAGTAVRETVEASGGDVERFTRDALPQAAALVGELRAAAANLRRVSERLERDPGILIRGAPVPPPGPGESAP